MLAFFTPEQLPLSSMEIWHQNWKARQASHQERVALEYMLSHLSDDQSSITKRGKGKEEVSLMY